jgi:ribonuclease BN (tRNA processing enzyme)
VYRITWRGQSVVYATDVEGYVGADRKLVQFAKDSDVLIHDAQYSEEHYRGELAGFPSTQGYGHSTVGMACEVAAASEAGQLVLFHHDPSYSDAMIAGLEASAKAQFGEAQAAYEGLELVLQETRKIAKKLQSSDPQVRDVQYANHD